MKKHLIVSRFNGGRGLLAAAACLAAMASATASEQLRDLISDATSKTVATLTDLKNAGNLNPETSLDVIQQFLAPHISYPALAQAAMGKHWRKAAAGERDAITEQFKLLLERTYAVTMSKFTGQSISVSEARELEDGSISVLTEIQDATVENVMREVDGEWKITDIKVEGVSLISNYRRQFDSVVRQHSITRLIEALRQKNEAG